MLKENKVVKKSDVLRFCSEKAGEEIPNPIFLKIIKELTISKGIAWVIKIKPFFD